MSVQQNNCEILVYSLHSSSLFCWLYLWWVYAGIFNLFWYIFAFVIMFILIVVPLYNTVVLVYFFNQHSYRYVVYSPKCTLKNSLFAWEFYRKQSFKCYVYAVCVWKREVTMMIVDVARWKLIAKRGCLHDCLV